MDCLYIYKANGKKLCFKKNFNINLDSNIKINIDINIIQTILASLYTLTRFPIKDIIEAPKRFWSASMPSEAHLVTSE